MCKGNFNTCAFKKFKTQEHTLNKCNTSAFKPSACKNSTGHFFITLTGRGL